MRTKAFSLVVAAIALMAAACKNELNVTNPNNPNVQQTLATATDIEAVFAQGFLQYGFSATGVHTNNL